MTDIASQTAELLVRSRSTDNPLIALPAALEPADLDQAYAVQDATLRRIGRSGGWKVAPKPDGDPRCALLPAAVFHASGVTLQVPANGFEIEVETAFTFGPDGGIVSVHLAVELISSRFRNRKGISVFTSVADLQGNAAVVVGPAHDPNGLDLAALQATLMLDGTALDLPQRHAGLAATLPTLDWLAEHARRRGHPLGTVITGARIGPVPLGRAQRLEASVPGLGAVLITFTH